MKKRSMNIRIIFTCLVTALLLNACTNDLNLTSDWKDISVVYGLINKSDQNHYIRVEKAFLDEETSALLLAQEADSIFYEDVSVFLEKVNSGEQFELQRVDGTQIGFDKEEGIFVDEPNFLYTIDSTSLDLKNGELVKFILNRGDNLPQVTANTVVLGDMELKSPGSNGDSRTFSFAYEFNEDVRFTAPEEALIFDVRLRINYQEFKKADPGSTLEDKSLEWIWDRSATRASEGDQQVKVEINGESFFTYLGDNLENNPELGRIYKGIDVIITGGGEELATFIEIKNANTGITSAQDLPFYTNLSEGRGVFSSRNTLEVFDIEIAPNTRDSLRNGIHTMDLNFL
jgi:hypothetical protein